MPQPKVRPAPVTFISIYYFCAAAFISIVVLFSLFDPEMHIASRLLARMVVYIFTRHNLIAEPLIPIVMPFIAAYMLCIGWGLWRLQKWSRHLVIVTSGMTVVLWLRALVVRGWALEEPLFHDQLARQSVYIVILINSVIFCCLTMYPDVARAFGDDQQ